MQAVSNFLNKKLLNFILDEDVIPKSVLEKLSAPKFQYDAAIAAGALRVFQTHVAKRQWQNLGANIVGGVGIVSLSAGGWTAFIQQLEGKKVDKKKVAFFMVVAMLCSGVHMALRNSRFKINSAAMAAILDGKQEKALNLIANGADLSYPLEGSIFKAAVLKGKGQHKVVAYLGMLLKAQKMDKLLELRGQYGLALVRDLPTAKVWVGLGVDPAKNVYNYLSLVTSSPFISTPEKLGLIKYLFKKGASAKKGVFDAMMDLKPAIEVDRLLSTFGVKLADVMGLEAQHLYEYLNHCGIDITLPKAEKLVLQLQGFSTR